MKNVVSKAKHIPKKRVLKEDEFGGSERTVSIRGRLWLEVNNETYIAPGRITLLERIDEFGSITKAAKSMEMSYRHAWILVNDMNAKASSPLVVRVSGGKGGGGTSLTNEGKAAVKAFNKMLKELKKLTMRLEKRNLHES